MQNTDSRREPTDQERARALFYAQEWLIPLLRLEEAGELTARISELAAGEHEIPFSRRLMARKPPCGVCSRLIAKTACKGCIANLVEMQAGLGLCKLIFCSGPSKFAGTCPAARWPES
jgi:hypothetical protein